MQILFITLVLLGLATTTNATTAAEPRQHAIAMHGKPALAANFTHFPYVNPIAPKGGRLTLASRGSFDSLNPFIHKGVTPTGVRGLVYESLLARSSDEAFTLYGLIAQSIEVAPDRSSWITFHLNPAAAWADGKPITTDDVIFSHDLLRRKGRPYLRSHYNKVGKAERLSSTTVKFHFKRAGDREIPLIMGLMPILPKHAIDPDTFDKTTLKPPLGSGPYIVSEVDPGHSLTYRRNPKHWAANHPARRGMHNFDELRIIFYRDATAVFEAFKTGAVDVRSESDPARWINGYDFPAMKDGRVRKLKLKTGKPAGMSGLIFNTRQKKFADIRVRKAFALAFDGPSINKSLYHGRFVRSASYFARSDLASTGKAADARELALLKPFPNAVSQPIMSGTWSPATTNSKLGSRGQLKQAFELLKQAGYVIRSRQLVNAKTDQPFQVEFLISSTAQERIALYFIKNLKRLGISAAVRKVEASQYWARIGKFEFDIMQFHYSASLSPGNEQINRWASSHANIQNSLNFAGVKNPAVDATIKRLLTATDRADFVAAVRAFDRTLLSGHYLIPLFHIPEQWYAVWSHLRLPDEPPLLGTDYAMWWHAGDK